MKTKILMLLAFLCFCFTISSRLLVAQPISSAELTKPLKLKYSTYLGGDSADHGNTIAVDSKRHAYVSGSTLSLDFPSQDSYQLGPINKDVFITKFSKAGNSLIYSTFLGGSGDDGTQKRIAVDSSGCVYAVGHTSSSDFPLESPYQSTLAGGGYDAFVTKLSSSGSSLIYSTYLGGDSNDNGMSICFDNLHEPSVAGVTNSSNFPLQDPYQAAANGVSDVFIAKFTSSGSSLLFSSYLGGSSSDNANSIATDDNRCLYVAGYTSSSDFPVVSAYQEIFGGIEDAILFKLSSSGSALIFSTYLGGNSTDICNSVAVDSGNQVYLTGGTSSRNFPLKDPYQEALSSGPDVFISIFSESGSTLISSTYLGGNSVDFGYDLAIDPSLSIHLTGYTWSTNFPLENPYQSSFAGPGDGSGGDAFVSKLSTSPLALVYSTYLGGSNNDHGNSIAVDPYYCAYVTGFLNSDDFPVKNPFQSTLGGGIDAFVVKLDSNNPHLPILESGDYNGDGTADVAIFMPDSGLWAIKGISRLYFGGSEDLPASGDYNGDGTTDVAIYRPANNLWAIKGINRFYHGYDEFDRPAPGDYNGDGTCDIAVYAESFGLWDIRDNTRVYFGDYGDLPIPGDYDNNGKFDLAIFRPANGLWLIRGLTRKYFGREGDIPLPPLALWSAPEREGGAPVPRVGIFRPTTGLWAIKDLTRFYWGAPNDIPVPANFSTGSPNDTTIFRPTTGLWAVSAITRCYFGGPLGIPISR